MTKAQVKLVKKRPFHIDLAREQTCFDRVFRKVQASPPQAKTRCLAMRGTRDARSALLQLRDDISAEQFDGTHRLFVPHGPGLRFQ